MDLIDDEGRLFGVVNIIDALVVLLAIAVVVAGLALVSPFGGGQDKAVGTQANRYVTLELGPLPATTTDQIATGDQVTVNASGEKHTITDIYVSPGPNDTVYTFVRVELGGTLVPAEGNAGEVFEFGGKTVPPGRPLVLETANYSITGKVRSTSKTGQQLPVENRSVVVRTELPTTTADAIASGDRYRVVDRSVAAIESVHRYPTANLTTERVLVGLSLQTIRTDGATRFAGRHVKLGSNVSFDHASYDLKGRVIRLDSASPPGEPATTTVVVTLTGVAPEIADNLRSGMTETMAGTQLARITDRQVDPATMVVTDSEGQVHERQHPRKKDVRLTLELSTRRTDTGLWFHGQPLRSNRRIHLDFGTITVRGTVVEIRE